MGKMEHLRKIKETGIVAVIRAADAREALRIVEAVKKGGINTIEITMTVPGAIEVIKEVSKTYDSKEVLLGAGSVLDSETARACLLAGAQFVVSPILDEEIIALCNSYQKIVMAGAMSVTEVVKAMRAGTDIVKVFPAALFGPAIIKAIKGPIPQAPLLPTGGVNVDNVDQWIKAGSVAVGVGGALTAGAKKGDFEGITRTAAQFIEKIKATREEMQKN